MNMDFNSFANGFKLLCAQVLIQEYTIILSFKLHYTISIDSCCCFQFSVVDCGSVWCCQCCAGDSVYSRAFYLYEEENGEQISTTTY